MQRFIDENVIEYIKNNWKTIDYHDLNGLKEKIICNCHDLYISQTDYKEKVDLEYDQKIHKLNLHANVTISKIN